MDLSQRFHTAKRAIIERDFARLSDTQRRAALHVRGPMLILAGAGSGKTTVLVSRIANIIKYGDAYTSDVTPPGLSETQVELLERCAADEGVWARHGDEAARIISHNPPPPWAVLAITFTNKAAGELKERIARVASRGEEVWASTFHSACVRMLRRDIERMGYSRSFTIYDSDDTQRLIKDCMKELRIDDKNFPPRSVQAVISSSKDKLVTVAEFVREAGSDFRMQKIGQVYELYQKRLKTADALDFDDIIMLTVRMLQQHDDIREYYRKRFSYICVDEYQDTNHAQYMLISLLAGGHRNLCVVGDDDQSIYKFRGAVIENILSFEHHYEEAEVIRLEQNYRSTKHILSAANGLIANNEGRKGKTLWTDNPEGDKVRVFKAADEAAEALYISESITDEIISNGRVYGDFAIIYRVNAQSNTLETALRKAGIPYRIIGGIRFYERREVKDMLAYLSVIANPNDDLRLRRIINEPKRGIGTTTIDALAGEAAALGVSMFDVASEAKLHAPLQKAAGKLIDFTQMMDKLRAQLGTVPLAEFVPLVAEKSGYLASLVAQDPNDEQERVRHIDELTSSVMAYERDSESPTLAGFLEEVALVSDIDSLESGEGAVVMMTMHSAKGLEFPVVFMAGMEEGVFPGFRSMFEPGEVEEERRLCYVGITRAKQRLYMTHAHSRLLYGTTTYNGPSRFIKELAPGSVEEVGLVVGNSRLNVRQQAGGPAKFNASASFDRATHAAPQSSAPVLQLAVGDNVRHGVFGEGVVRTVKRMGGDAMLEVEFQKAGLKRLMQNYAKLEKQ